MLCILLASFSVATCCCCLLLLLLLLGSLNSAIQFLYLILRQEESSSYSCMLLLNTLQTPFPLRLLHPVLRPEHYSSIILFRWINSSASLAT